MNRLERLYAIQEQLRRRSPASVVAARLADEFGVTTRTIERDLVALRSAGVPIDGNVGRTGGYRLGRTKGNAVFSLNPEEVVALLLATQAATGMPFTAAATTATQRLLDALPEATRVRVEELRNRIRVAQPDMALVRPAVRRVVEAAVRDRLVVRLRYVDSDGVETSRSVEAHGFYGAGAWSMFFDGANIDMSSEQIPLDAPAESDPQVATDEQFFFEHTLRPSTWWQPDVPVIWLKAAHLRKPTSSTLRLSGFRGRYGWDRVSSGETDLGA